MSSHTFRRNQDVRARVLGEVLPGVHVRALWQSARGSPERDDSLLPEVAVRGGQAVCILVSIFTCGETSRSIGGAPMLVRLVEVNQFPENRAGAGTIETK